MSRHDHHKKNTIGGYAGQLFNPSTACTHTHTHTHTCTNTCTHTHANTQEQDTVFQGDVVLENSVPTKSYYSLQSYAHYMQ